MGIGASVGRNGINRRPDVETVQLLLNRHITSLAPLRPLVVDGRIGPNTIRAIEEFQSRIGNMRPVDGRVDPNGRTIRLLESADGKTPPPVPAPKPVVGHSAHSIKIVRKWATTESTVSEFQILDARPAEGEISRGFFLERPGPDTRESGLRKRILEGSYKMKWQTQTGLAGVRPHLPVPWLYNSNVSEGRRIYIHNGNRPSHTDGCLLIGTTRSTDFVGASVDALTKLKKYLNRVGIENVSVDVSSNYV